MALMTNGFSTTITITDLASGGSALFEEKEVTPPNLEGGGEIDVTTMRNTAWRTKVPKTLKDVEGMSLVVAYDPDFLTNVIALLNQNSEIVVNYPDSSTFTFYGYLDSFAPNAHTPGEQPTANITIIATNRTDAGVETAPVVA